MENLTEVFVVDLDNRSNLTPQAVRHYTAVDQPKSFEDGGLSVMDENGTLLLINAGEWFHTFEEARDAARLEAQARISRAYMEQQRLTRLLTDL